MKQKKPTKKQSINVQLSKEDLIELLRKVKEFTSEEISIQNKRLLSNQCEIERKIVLLEVVDSHQRAEIHRLKQHCLHEDKLDSIGYNSTGTLFAVVYKCKRCGRENRKPWLYLSRKEKKGLRKLGVKI